VNQSSLITAQFQGRWWAAHPPGLVADLGALLNPPPIRMGLNRGVSAVPGKV